MVHKPALADCVVKVVELRAGSDYDAVAPVKRAILRLGAKLLANFGPSLTHVVVILRHDDVDTDEAVNAISQTVRKVWNASCRATGRVIVSVGRARRRSP